MRRVCRPACRVSCLPASLPRIVPAGHPARSLVSRLPATQPSGYLTLGLHPGSGPSSCRNRRRACSRGMCVRIDGGGGGSGMGGRIDGKRTRRLAASRVRGRPATLGKGALYTQNPRKSRCATVSVAPRHLGSGRASPEHIRDCRVWPRRFRPVLVQRKVRNQADDVKWCMSRQT